MIDVISNVGTNSVAAVHMAAQAAGLNFSKEQIAEAVLAVRWVHLEAPTIGRAIYRTGVWIDSKGGFRGIMARLIGPKAVSTAATPPIPLHQNLGQ